MTGELESRLSSVGALVEPARRALYLYVLAQKDAVSRDQAAEALDLPHHTAKFHLDRLVDEELLEVEYRRLTGRTGPGAGRPAKLYRPSGREASVSLPERRYDFVGSLLAEAVDEATREGIPVTEAVRAAAERAGRRIAKEAVTAGAGKKRSCLDRTCQALAGYGFEPERDGRTAVLANCPFHTLSKQYTELVCGMNLSLVSSVVDALGCEELDVTLDPAPGRCCVVIRR